MKRILRWVLVVAAVLVALFVLMAASGMMLPQGHVAVVTAEYGQTPEAVWAVMTDFQEAPAWREGVDRMERLPDRDGRPVWRESGARGGMAFEVTEVDPPRRLVTTIVEDLPFGGRWIFEVEPAPAGSRVTITEEGEVYNPLFRFMSRFVFGHDATAKGYLRSLGRRFGEEVEPETVRDEWREDPGPEARDAREARAARVSARTGGDPGSDVAMRETGEARERR